METMNKEPQTNQPEAPNKIVPRCEQEEELRAIEYAAFEDWLSQEPPDDVVPESCFMAGISWERSRNAQADKSCPPAETAPLHPQNPADLLLIKELREEKERYRKALVEITEFGNAESYLILQEVAEAALQSPPQQGK